MRLELDPPRGGVVETVAGAPRRLCLRHAEIERFEDRRRDWDRDGNPVRRSIFEAFDAAVGRGRPLVSAEMREIVALGLVGGEGLDAAAADALAAAVPLDRLQAVFRGVICAAFFPDWDAPDAGAPGEDAPEKPAGGGDTTSGGNSGSPSPPDMG